MKTFNEYINEAVTPKKLLAVNNIKNLKISSDADEILSIINNTNYLYNKLQEKENELLERYNKEKEDTTILPHRRLDHKTVVAKFQKFVYNVVTSYEKQLKNDGYKTNEGVRVEAAVFLALDFEERNKISF